MELVAKLQMKPGQRVALLAGTGDVPSIVSDDVTAAESPEAADAIVAFVRTRADLGTVAVAAIDGARSGKLVWIAYPKAGKLGTDLNRDSLREALAEHGVQPVRQVAVDEVWSAMRFRPA
ncbi:DUF3052 family protein [Streptomyces sp. NPDC002004]